ncbi:MFS transporter [Rhodococcus sp. IEGM 1379]|uniref:MFS transporter n=1 Tax=Rhodococcus sp. IEGM 1379 TaxID=3047086 RepID=UPI0024B812EE|nr:MFS transporter [Rhodococcus sp. IEGM 1379]MDI9916061.1 MFS transporter [Rhodococcus sp. IEGM 1379]
MKHSNPPSYDRKRAWIVTGLLLVFMLINFADKAVLGLSAAPLMDHLGLSASQYGTISSGFFLLFSIAAIVGGVVSDRMPSKWLLLGMALVWSVAQLPMLVPLGAYGFWVVLGSRIVLGTAEGPAYPVANHAAHKWFPDKDRDLASGILTIGAPLGVVLAAPGLTWIISSFGWRSAFFVMAVLGLVWAAAWARFGQDGPIEKIEPVDAERAPDLTVVASTPLPYWRILASRTWIGSVMAGFAAYWALAVLISWIPIYAQKVLGFSSAATGFVIAVPWGIMALAMITQGLVSKSLTSRGVSTRITRGVLNSVVLLICGGFVFAALVVDPVWMKVLFMSLGFGMCAVSVPIGQALCSEISPAGRNGGVLGAFAAVYSLSGIIAPMLTGRIIDASGSTGAGFDRIFAITGVILLVGGVVSGVLIHPTRDRLRIARLGSDKGPAAGSHTSAALAHD